MTVTDPMQMNTMFAEAFNSRNIANLLALYEPDAVLRVGDQERNITGSAAIADELRSLLQMTGIMTSRNNFCMICGDIALLRADWNLIANDGSVIAAGSSAEVIRRQADETWLYIIDHAVGASLPRAG